MTETSAPASGTGSHATHEAPDGSPPIGFDPSRGPLDCNCGGVADVWKGNGVNGRYAYAECRKCHRKTGQFPSPKQAEVMWGLIRDRDASLAEDAEERLSPEGVAARAVTDGIAKDQPHD